MEKLQAFTMVVVTQFFGQYLVAQNGFWLGLGLLVFNLGIALLITFQQN